MDGTVVATGLVFPEGPVWVDGGVVVTEIEAGVLSRWTPDGGLCRIADVGGGPNGAALGPDGALYVTQNGGMFREGRVTPGILRVEADDGSSELIVTEVGGLTLDGPNDLAFGPDGRLYFTDPRGAADPARNDRPGRLFAFDVATASGDAAADGELIVELGPVFPNGIAFDADGTLLWTESFTRRVMRLKDGRREVVIELPARHAPDGMCFGRDGTLYVASTYAHCVSVIRDGEIVDRLMCGDGMVTNCCFGGTDLYVTDSRRGALYRFPLGVEGLPLGH